MLSIRVKWDGDIVHLELHDEQMLTCSFSWQRLLESTDAVDLVPPWTS